jgi:hypothetical protein
MLLILCPSFWLLGKTLKDINANNEDNKISSTVQSFVPRSLSYMLQLNIVTLVEKIFSTEK